jgi:hypothetical protein
MAIKLNKAALVKSLVNKNILAPHLDRLIDQGDFEWSATFSPKQGDDAFHPSGDCTPSLHHLYLMATGQLAERSIPINLRKTFMVGHFWHAWIQEMVVKLGFADPEAIERRGTRVWAYNAPPGLKDHTPKPFHWATGSGDIAPCRIPGHGEFLVDIKTQHGFAFKQNHLGDFAVKYECQVNVYMDWFDLDRALILCVSKETGELKEFIFERNQPLIDAIYQKWELVGLCVRDEVAPPEDEPFDLPVAGCVS